MRVLHINRHYIGTELHHILIEQLNKNSIDNRVFVPTCLNNVDKPYIDDHVKVVRCFKKRDRILYHYKQSKIFKALLGSYECKTFDLLHAYTVFTDGYSAYKIFLKYGIPYIVAVRNTDVNDFFKKLPWLRHTGVKILLNAKKILFLSDTYRDEVIGKYIPESNKEQIRRKSEIIPNGIDDFWHQNEAHCAKKKPEKTKVDVICVGRVDKNKNIPVIQEAINILIDEGVNCNLTLIGKVVDNDEYIRISKDKNTTYIKPMPKEQLIMYYRQSDVFVMPSITETFGLVYAEAMSQGLPIIYTKGQGFDGQFAEGMVGYSVDARSPEDVALKIKLLIDNYDKISMNVVAASRKFNWVEIGNRYCDIYNEIAAQNIE